MHTTTMVMMQELGVPAPIPSASMLDETYGTWRHEERIETHTEPEPKDVDSARDWGGNLQSGDTSQTIPLITFTMHQEDGDEGPDRGDDEGHDRGDDEGHDRGDDEGHDRGDDEGHDMK